MANFAIAADENVIARGNKLIEELQEPGEKKGVTLNRLFDLVSTHLQEDQLKRSGVDTEALDASITNIRNLFTAALSGKEEIRTEYERRMAELREKNEELEKNYKIQLGKLITEKEEALRKYNDLKELQETAESARKAAEEQTASAVNLAKEKGLKKIAFPLISAGVYGYPQRDAIRVAIETMKLHQDDFDEITLVLFGEREFGFARENYPEFI